MGLVGLGFRKLFAKVECDELTQILTLNCYVAALKGAGRSGFWKTFAKKDFTRFFCKCAKSLRKVAKLACGSFPQVARGVT